MKYITVGEMAGKYGVNVSLIRRYCKQNRIDGVVCRGGIWCIPEDAVLPERKKRSFEYSPEMPPLAAKLYHQKNGHNYHGFYDYVQINLTYSSSRMASCRLTRDQVETIFRKGKVRESFEPMKVSDLIEVMNHCLCVDYILDHVMEPLTQRFIKKLHDILMYGTVDDRMERVRPGEFRTASSKNRNRKLLPAKEINSSLGALLREYENRDDIERNEILDFHVRFEQIFPFEDGNGRVGRLIMFKECLRHDVLPFILDDKRRSRYLRGIREWPTDRMELIDVVLEAQLRFDAQIALQSSWPTPKASCRMVEGTVVGYERRTHSGDSL